MSHASLIEHLLTPFRLLWLTAEILVRPSRLCPTWSIPALPLAQRLDGDVLEGMFLAAGLLTLMVFLWRRRSILGAMLAGTLVILAMPTHALPLAHFLYAERWLYLPTVFIAVLIGALCSRLGKTAAIGALAVAVILLPESWQYGSKFANNVTMHREVIRRQPNNFHGRRNLASVLCFEKRYSEAIQAANELLDRFEPVSDAYSVLMKSYLEIGDGRQALDAINKYQALRRFMPGPSLTEERNRALSLINQQRRRSLESQPATSPTSSEP